MKDFELKSKLENLCQTIETYQKRYGYQERISMKAYRGLTTTADRLAKKIRDLDR